MFLTRHSDMIKDVDMNRNIIIVGAGSIGSYATLALAKLGFQNLFVIDDGMVEEENLAPQFYGTKDIGLYKVKALKKAIKAQCNIEITALDFRLDDTTKAVVNDITQMGTNTTNKPIVVVAVDSMFVRKWIHNNMYRNSGLVDARMAIEFLAVYSMVGSEKARESYSKTLHSDDDSVQEACTNKAISYTSLIAGGLVAKCVLDRLKGTAQDFQVINFDINSFDMVRL